MANSSLDSSLGRLVGKIGRKPLTWTPVVPRKMANTDMEIFLRGQGDIRQGLALLATTQKERGQKRKKENLKNHKEL